MPKKKKNQRIKKRSAVQINWRRGETARAIDATRKSKKVNKFPDSNWAKHPEKSDVAGIDDGSKLAKQRNQGVIHAFFSKIGRRGAAKTNAKRANKELLNQKEQIDKFKKAISEAPTKEREEELRERLKKLIASRCKNQMIVARWQEGSY